MLAAAVSAHADCIVTDNLRDFPAEILQPFEIEAIDPDTFIFMSSGLPKMSVAERPSTDKTAVQILISRGPSTSCVKYA